MIAFRQTVLPVPVRPAISRCGSVGQIDRQRLAADVLAQEERNPHLLDLAVGLFDHFAEPDDLPLLVGHFDADRVLAGNRRDDADAGHAQGDRQVVGQAGDLRQPQAGFELDFVLGDDRAGVDLDDLHREAEVERTSFPGSWPCGGPRWPGPRSSRRRWARAARATAARSLPPATGLASFIRRISSSRSRSAASFLRSAGFLTRSGFPAGPAASSARRLRLACRPRD